MASPIDNENTKAITANTEAIAELTEALAAEVAARKAITLNLTDDQQAAVDSGITADKVVKLDMCCTVGIAGEGRWRISSALVDTTKDDILY